MKGRANQTVTTNLQVRPWYRDHCFAGRTVLPAVEAIILLAEAAQNLHPDLNIRNMADAFFPRFLEIPEDSRTIEVQIEIADEPGGIRARLLTRTRFKSISRLIEHCSLLFGVTHESSTPLELPTARPKHTKEVTAETIYMELVPFGRAFQTLQGHLSLDGDLARGQVRTPDLPMAFALLGSPFALDGAMHAACVHGQQVVAFVPLPTGFASRTITCPTRPGERYGVRVKLCSQRADELVYDLEIVDGEGKSYEAITGLRMQDAGRGRIRSPDWIRKTD